jgi:uncharacterized protein (UPF0332 family)
MKRMGLEEKSIENLNTVDICITNGHYNAGVNRAYYAAFQMIKNYLIEIGYDKNSVKDEDGNSVTFSHGMIAKVLLDYLLEKYDLNYIITNPLDDYDALYKARSNADYTDKMANLGMLTASKKHALEIKNIIVAVKRGDYEQYKRS